MTMRRLTKLLFYLLCSGGLILAYNNCSPLHQGEYNAALTNGACGTAEELFAQTYHPFLTKNCASCHVTGGIGKGAFADDSLQVAWRSFRLVGFAKVSEYAVNPGHNPPHTGAHNQQAIAVHSQNWINGQQQIDRCLSGEGSGGDASSGGEDIGPRIHSIGKKLAGIGVGSEATLRWNLASEVDRIDQELLDAGYSLPDLAGAEFEITVSQIDIPGQVAYAISKPRLINNSASDLRVSSLMASINSVPISGQTTFKYLQAEVRQGTGDGVDELLSFGSLVAEGQLNSSDSLSVNFGKIEAITMDPLDPGPIAEFELAQQTAPSESGTVPIKIVLSQPPKLNEPVYLGLTVDAGEGAKTRNGEKFDNYDWDYVVDTLGVNFAPGETEKTIFVDISDDQRDEADEKITFRIESSTNATVGTKASHVLTIPDDDPPSAEGEITLTMLMTGNGVLLQRCLECHNNGDRQGGYDMSDYNLMVANGVIVPGDPAASKMIKRIKGEVTPQMPFDQPLTPTERILIESWIMGGAKNN